MQAWELSRTGHLAELISRHPKIWAVFAAESVVVPAMGTALVNTGVVLSLDVAWSATATTCNRPGAQGVLVVPAAVPPAVHAPGLCVELRNSSSAAIVVSSGDPLAWILFCRLKTPRACYVYPELSCSVRSMAPPAAVAVTCEVAPAADPKLPVAGALPDAGAADASVLPVSEGQRRRRPRANRANARLRTKTAVAL